MFSVILRIKYLVVEKKSKSRPVHVRHLIKNWLTKYLLVSSIRKERRALSRMTDEELFDVGISRDDAKRESERSFWDVPKNRKRTSIEQIIQEIY